jgi:hypothetical protein
MHHASETCGIRIRARPRPNMATTSLRDIGESSLSFLPSKDFSQCMQQSIGDVNASRPLVSRTIAALSMLLPYACSAPSPGLIPHASLECQPGGTRPSWPQALLRFPLKVSPKQVLAPGPYALRSRKGTAGMGSARN